MLVRPSAMLSAMMVVLRPFLSLKAARKLHKVLRAIIVISCRWKAFPCLHCQRIPHLVMTLPSALPRLIAFWISKSQQVATSMPNPLDLASCARFPQIPTSTIPSLHVCPSLRMHGS